MMDALKAAMVHATMGQTAPSINERTQSVASSLGKRDKKWLQTPSRVVGDCSASELEPSWAVAGGCGLAPVRVPVNFAHLRGFSQRFGDDWNQAFCQLKGEE
jgi:hypothetical protein